MISLLIVVIESYFRFTNPLLNDFTRLREYFFIVLVVSLTAFVNKKFAMAFLTFLLLFISVQLAHYNYFGSLIFPMEIYLSFTKQHEIMDTLQSMLDILTVPTVIFVASMFLLVVTQKWTAKRRTSRWMTLLFVVILVFPIVRTGVGYKKHQLGERPNELWSLARNSIAVTDHFLGKTLPLLLLEKSTVARWDEKAFEKRKDFNNTQNVVLIIGESLTSQHMSLYGYEKETTPYFDKLSKEKQCVFRQGISAGVVTDSSIPMIINAARRPNALLHIINGTNNLFKLAKEQGFHTYFITAQSQEAFKYIRTYLNPKYIDTYIDSSDAGYDYFTIAHDSVLLDDFKSIPLKSGKNFVVLNMAGSHSPYKKLVPADYHPFGDQKIVDQYDNSVHYSDTILHKIFSMAALEDMPTTFLFTSDHGELVSEHGFGHGRLDKACVYHVPFILYALHTNLPESVKGYLEKSFYASHYKLALITAYLLGYDTIKDHQDANYQAFVNGRDLNGVDGFIEVDYNKTSLQRKKQKL